MHFVALEKLVWLMENFWSKSTPRYLKSMGIEYKKDVKLSEFLMEMNESEGNEAIIEIMNAVLMDNDLRNCYRTNWNINFVYVNEVVNDMLELVKKQGYNVEDLKIETEKVSTVPVTFDFIEEDFSEDRFYSDLVNEINGCYRHGFLIAANNLIRKILENLLIDVLRAKYKPKVNMWYWTDRRRPHDFSKLLQTFEETLSDFIPYSSTLKSTKPIEMLREFKQIGDASTHSIAVFVDKPFLDDNREKINHLIILLHRLLKKMP